MHMRTHVKLRTIGDRVQGKDTRKVQPPPKTVDPFYTSAPWRKLMDSIIAERGRICQDQHCDGKTHSPGMRVFGDHIIELRDGGAPLDRHNVRLLCGAAHTRKTAAARAQRLAAKPDQQQRTPT